MLSIANNVKHGILQAIGLQDQAIER